jgi:hypothetical protein
MSFPVSMPKCNIRRGERGGIKNARIYYKQNAGSLRYINSGQRQEMCDVRISLHYIAQTLHGG